MSLLLAPHTLELLRRFFSRRGFFTAMNSPEVLLRLVKAELRLQLRPLLDRALAGVIADRLVHRHSRLP
jgi:hypothetical protein